VDGLLGTSVSASDMLVTRGHGRTSGDRSAAWSGLVTSWSSGPTHSLLADFINMAGGACVAVPLSNDLHHNLERLADSLGGTRMFVVCVHARA
jgi:hypothetical protein